VATDDLEQLRREIARLRIKNEILEKAAIYFARESL
jgi:transposase-like protein